jgi:hypothetical protein
MILDTIFGVLNFRNEIVWKRTSAHNDTKQGKILHMGRIHDVILFYTKTENATKNPVYSEYDDNYLTKNYRHVDANGRKYRLDNLTGPGGASKGNAHYEFLGVTRYWRYSRENMEKLYQEGRIIQTAPGRVPSYKRYLDEMPGVSLQDVWTDITPIQSKSDERLGYPTQKPLALLERIIQASSNPGDVILDPFAGCGTAVNAAQKLGRRWIGIDVTHLAITVQKRQMERLYGLRPNVDYEVIGEPQDVGSARELAQNGRHQFEYWAISLVGALPSSVTGTSGGRAQGKKGGDGGIDGEIVFLEPGNKPKRVLVSVKSNETVNPSMVRDLRGVIEREKAEIGLFICLTPPTAGMTKEALAAGKYKHPSGKEYPRLQVLSIADLLGGKRPELPGGRANFAAGERIKSGRGASPKQSVMDWGEDEED